jgi:RNA polymerase sigma factor (sigma-70 family)
LLRIARNRVVDAHRRRIRRSAIIARFFGNPDTYDPRDGVEEQVVLREEARLAIECARRLAARDRLLIGLRIMAGLSHAEIASVVGTSERTAAALTSRALGRLRRLYEAAV